jgi:DNA-binding GntR family transcriptional regulator
VSQRPVDPLIGGPSVFCRPPHSRPKRSCAEREEIVDAPERRDGEALAGALRRHLLIARDRGRCFNAH